MEKKRRAGITRPALDFLIIKLSNSRVVVSKRFDYGIDAYYSENKQR